MRNDDVGLYAFDSYAAMMAGEKVIWPACSEPRIGDDVCAEGGVFLGKRVIGAGESGDAVALLQQRAAIIKADLRCAALNMEQ